MFLFLLSLLPLASPHGLPREFDLPPTPPNVRVHDVSYTCNGLSYQGYAAIPLSTGGGEEERPGVLIGHTWTGLGLMEKYRAAQIASKLGFVAFALDVYGTNIRPTDDTAAKIEMDKILQNVTDFHSRINCGLQQLLTTSSHGGSGCSVNSSLIFANGYCFGGVMMLELARLGTANLQAVASFHGELGNLTSQTNDKISAVVQVHHADLDFQKAQGLLLFEDEMRSENVTHWTTTKYGQVSHGWTDPTSVNYKKFEADQAHNNMFGLYTQMLE